MKKWWRSRSTMMGLIATIAYIIHAITSCCVYALSSPASTSSNAKPHHRIAIIGGGSSGMFAAASIIDTIRNHNDPTLADCVDVKVYESTREGLRSIRTLSDVGQGKDGAATGGGILYDTSKKPREVLNMGYPRGRKEITSLLTKTFPPLQQQTWFEDRGVEFTTQMDGSMVAVVDSDHEDSTSSDNSVINAILQNGVHDLVQTNSKITSISKDDQKDCFQLTIQNNDDNVQEEQKECCDSLILATGYSHLGHQLARSLGHTIAVPARSSFAFNLSTEDDPILSNLHHYESDNRLHLPYVRLSYKVKIEGQKRPRVFKSEGPAEIEIMRNNKNDDMAIILGGNAALSLSSMACYELQNANYKGSLLVHFCPDHLGGKVENLEEYLWQYRQDNPNEVVGSHCPLLHHQVDYDEYDWETESFKTITNECIPSELWECMTEACGVPPNSPWSKTSPKKVRKLSELIVGCPLEFIGRSSASTTQRKNSSYINAGGIRLNEIDMTTMQSKVVNGLYCCGQILDGDGSFMSFALMRDFATGKVAGESVVLNAVADQSINNFHLSRN